MQQDLPLEEEVFEQRVEFVPAKHWMKPKPSRNYGVIGMRIYFVLIGPKGAISWMLSPSWYVAESRAHLANFARTQHEIDRTNKPDAWDLGYHAYEPQYEDQGTYECTYLKGGKCYCDGTSLGALDLVEGFLAGGDVWLWRKLREVYESRFNGAPYPDFTPEYEPHPDDKVKAGA